MRGEVCVSAATILSFVAILLMIFVHVGQINTATVPRSIAMAKLNISTYSNALEQSIPDPFQNIYTTNASAPLGVKAGLRYFYDFGLYSYCAYLNDSLGTCSNITAGNQYRPFDIVTSDMAANYSIITQALTVNTAFQDSSYLGDSTKAAYWMLLFGTLLAFLALVTGFLKTHFTFFLSAIFAVAASGMILIGASIWTIMIKKSAAVEHVMIGSTASATPIGIIISVGTGLYLTWAAFACLVFSVIPYTISCCTWRG